MPRILSVSRNPRLLAKRNDALAMAGYGVASPKDPRDATLLVVQEKFDAVIIGHSVEGTLRNHLIESIRDLRPTIPVVFAHPTGTEEEPLADVTVDAEEDPYAIVNALDKLLRRASSRRP